MLILALLQLVPDLVAHKTREPAPSCASVAHLMFIREADLPAGALGAFGAPMAEKGQPFQGRDLNLRTPALPLFRFVSAEQRGCSLRITYEHGGNGLRVAEATLVDNGSGWKRVERLPLS